MGRGEPSSEPEATECERGVGAPRCYAGVGCLDHEGFDAPLCYVCGGVGGELAGEGVFFVC